VDLEDPEAGIEAKKGKKHKDKRVNRKRKNKEDQSKAYNKKKKEKA